MASVRQNKAGRLVQKVLSNIFLRESRNLFNNAMISVTQVRMSPDLKVAKVFLSFFGSGNKEVSMEKVFRVQGEIRRQLGTEMKHQLRHIPELQFHLDDSLDYAEEIENLLKNDKTKK